MAQRPRIPVFPGRNVWRLIRSAVDKPDASQLPQQTAAFTRFAVTGRTGPTPALIPTAENEWRMGDLRPLRVLSVKRGGPAPSISKNGRLLVDRQRLRGVDAIPAARSTAETGQPWWIVLEFWWRGDPAHGIDYPAYVSGLFGPSFQLTGADWVLDQARADEGAKDPGDERWTDAQGDRAGELARSATGHLANIFGTVAGLQGIVLLGALWLLFGRDK